MMRYGVCSLFSALSGGVGSAVASGMLSAAAYRRPPSGDRYSISTRRSCGWIMQGYGGMVCSENLTEHTAPLAMHCSNAWRKHGHYARTHREDVLRLGESSTREPHASAVRHGPGPLPLTCGNAASCCSTGGAAAASRRAAAPLSPDSMRRRAE